MTCGENASSNNECRDRPSGLSVRHRAEIIYLLMNEKECELIIGVTREDLSVSDRFKNLSLLERYTT
jgi:hypothetical protein